MIVSCESVLYVVMYYVVMCYVLCATMHKLCIITVREKVHKTFHGSYQLFYQKALEFNSIHIMNVLLLLTRAQRYY